LLEGVAGWLKKKKKKTREKQRVEWKRESRKNRVLHFCGKETGSKKTVRNVKKRMAIPTVHRGGDSKKTGGIRWGRVFFQRHP